MDIRQRPFRTRDVTSRRKRGNAPVGVFRLQGGRAMYVVATLYEWLLFLHVIAVMVWVGGVVVLGALSALVLRNRDAAASARFVGMLRVVGPAVLAPAPAVALGAGIWM